MTAIECVTVDRNQADNLVSVDWKQVDSNLAWIAKRRAGLDAEEMRWLRQAERVRIWHEVGCVSLLDYLERRMGYGPRVAAERMRVARALEELPALEAALANGMPYSAVRELTRIVTPETEQEWIDECRGATVHEVEQRVAGHSKGSRPKDPPNPKVVTRPLTFEHVTPATLALLRQARQKLQEERKRQLTDDELLATALGALLEQGEGGESGRAKYQVAYVVCGRCNQGWQEGAGRKFAVERADVERACCDAQHIGSLDGVPERAVQDVPPRVRRFVFRRDGGRCAVPGCRSTANLEIHHLTPRSLGGTHDPSNLSLTCDGCHAAHHRGLIEISGRAGELVVKRLHVFDTHAETSARDTGVDVVVAAPARGEERPTAPHPHVGIDSARAESRLAAPHLHVNIANASPESPSVVGVRASSRDESMSRFERAAMRTQACDALVGMGFKRHEARVAVETALDEPNTSTLQSLLFKALRNLRPKTG